MSVYSPLLSTPNRPYCCSLNMLLQQSSVKQALDDISFTREKLHIVGSYSNPNLTHYSDIDCNETIRIKDVESFCERLSDKIRYLAHRYVFTDIKIGLFPDYEININESKVDIVRQLIELHHNFDVDTRHALAQVLNMPSSLTEANRFALSKLCRFHIARWRPIDVVNGYLISGIKCLSLVDALQMPSLIKIDILVTDEKQCMTELTCVYNLVSTAGKKINAYNSNYYSSVINDYKGYLVTKDYYKALKRHYLLAKLLSKDTHAIEIALNKAGIYQKLIAILQFSQNDCCMEYVRKQLKELNVEWSSRSNLIYKLRNVSNKIAYQYIVAQ